MRRAKELRENLQVVQPSLRSFMGKSLKVVTAKKNVIYFARPRGVPLGRARPSACGGAARRSLSAFSRERET